MTMLENEEREIHVSVAKQKAYLKVNGRIVRAYPVSTAKNGVGSEKGSLKTPLGLHRIYNKIGLRALKGAVFKDRIRTGEVWDGVSQKGDLILSRIIQLEGLEPGKNRGGNVDTRLRYIYFHGTNHVKNIGKPSSHGCIIMRCDDIIDLFNRVKKGDKVVIRRN
jgi:UDP-N-acetylmuramate--alanine ligase